MGAGVDKQRAAAIVVLLKVLAQWIQQATSALALDRSAVVVGHGGGGTVGTVHRAGTAAAGGRQHLNAQILLNPADHAVTVLSQIAVQRVADPIVGQLGGLHALELLMPELGVGHVGQIVVEGFQVQIHGLVGFIGIALAVQRGHGLECAAGGLCCAAGDGQLLQPDDLRTGLDGSQSRRCTGRAAAYNHHVGVQHLLGGFGFSRSRIEGIARTGGFQRTGYSQTDGIAGDGRAGHGVHANRLRSNDALRHLHSRLAAKTVGVHAVHISDPGHLAGLLVILGLGQGDADDSSALKGHLSTHDATDDLDLAILIRSNGAVGHSLAGVHTISYLRFNLLYALGRVESLLCCLDDGVAGHSRAGHHVDVRALCCLQGFLQLRDRCAAKVRRFLIAGDGHGVQAGFCILHQRDGHIACKAHGFALPNFLGRGGEHHGQQHEHRQKGCHVLLHVSLSFRIGGKATFLTIV